MSPGSVQVWQERRGAWRWRYLEPAAGHGDAGSRADLPSHTDYPTAEAALEDARTSYPDVPVEVEVPPGDARESAVRRWAGRVALLVVVVLAARRAGSRRRRTVSS